MVHRLIIATLIVVHTMRLICYALNGIVIWPPRSPDFMIFDLFLHDYDRGVVLGVPVGNLFTQTVDHSTVGTVTSETLLK
jgi:uncharacterized membrane protein